MPTVAWTCIIWILSIPSTNFRNFYQRLSTSSKLYVIHSAISNRSETRFWASYNFCCILYQRHCVHLIKCRVPIITSRKVHIFGFDLDFSVPLKCFLYVVNSSYIYTFRREMLYTRGTKNKTWRLYIDVQSIQAF